MLNLRVDDLDAVLDKLRAGGVEIDSRREDYDYGRFAWFKDPEGNRVSFGGRRICHRPEKKTGGASCGHTAGLWSILRARGRLRSTPRELQ
jgi:catechol 2,3-dioxygenase-like lactoylglutathione lyase family enzyme